MRMEKLTLKDIHGTNSSFVKILVNQQDVPTYPDALLDLLVDHHTGHVKRHLSQQSGGRPSEEPSEAVSPGRRGIAILARAAGYPNRNGKD
jgi:hypothetical protein